MDVEFKDLLRHFKPVIDTRYTNELDSLSILKDVVDYTGESSSGYSFYLFKTDSSKVLKHIDQKTLYGSESALIADRMLMGLGGIADMALTDFNISFGESGLNEKHSIDSDGSDNPYRHKAALETLTRHLARVDSEGVVNILYNGHGDRGDFVDMVAYEFSEIIKKSGLKYRDVGSKELKVYLLPVGESLETELRNRNGIDLTLSNDDIGSIISMMELKDVKSRPTIIGGLKGFKNLFKK